MITLDVVVAFALRNPAVMDQLGEALRSDLVLANPHQRRLVEFADDYLVVRRKLPGEGDWQVWLETVEAGMLRDSAREALGRLLTVDLSGHDPEFFAGQVLPQLQQGAATNARSRLNDITSVTPEAFATLAERLSNIQAGSLQGLARLQDIETWSRQVREDELVSTGYPTLNRYIGGWGKELWMVFADSGVGKSMLLQNFATNAARSGKQVLHVTLELGLRPQIHRYYRQLAQMTRGEWAQDSDEAKRRLRQWFRFAKGSVYLLEYPAFGLDVPTLKRTIDRAARIMERVDVLVLDYLDLLAPTGRGRGSDYADLGRLTHETRAFCPAFDMTVLTASQAVRRPANAKRLTQRDMGDSYQKVRGADGLLSLVQTDEEKEVHQGRLGLIKIRDGGGGGSEIALYVNREMSVIQELDHPNTVALMKRLGHLPSAAPPAPASPPPSALTP